MHETKRMTPKPAYDKLEKMRKWKSFFVFLIIVSLTAGTACIIDLLLRPRLSEIERVFDGTEVLFVEGKGLLTAWRDLNRTDYWKTGTYKGLLELPPVRDFLGSMTKDGTSWTERISPDAVMSAIGDESALGIYVKGASPRLLFVSRVDPNFLLMDRILVLLGNDAGIVIIPYRGMRVKEGPLDEGRSLFWTLDGDFLILSDDSDIFYAAVDRHIDKETGPIITNGEFRRLKRNRSTSELVSGYAVTKRLISIPGIEGAVPDAVGSLLPTSFRFSLSYADGTAVLDVRSRGGLDMVPHLWRRAKMPVPVLRDDEMAAVCMGRIPAPSPSTRDAAGPPLPGDTFPGLLPSLFPNGFSVSVIGGPRSDGVPGMVALGRESSSFFKAVEEVRKRADLVESRATVKGSDLSILRKDGVAYLAWTQRGDRILVSDRPDLLEDMPVEGLERCRGFRYNNPDGEITFMIRPRLIHRNLIASGKPIAMSYLDLSIDEQRRLFAALYPADEIDGYVSLVEGELKIKIGIHVEDTIP
jgi:hypothetical protein